MLSKGIAKLVQYGVESGLVPECEKNYTTNLLLDVFHEDEYTEPEEKFSGVDLEETLNELLDEAVKRGLIEDSVVYRDLFDTRLRKCTARMEKSISRSIFPNRKKIRKRSQQQRMSKQAVIRNVCSARKTRDTQAVLIIRRDRTTESFRSRSMIHHGASSILHMYITMNTVLCLTASIPR